MRQVISVELCLDQTDPAVVGRVVNDLAAMAKSEPLIAGIWAGGSEGFDRLGSLSDLDGIRQLDECKVSFHGMNPAMPYTAISLLFSGTPAVVEGRSRLADYRCQRAELTWFVEDGVTTDEGWEWVWDCYRMFMELPELPSPWIGRIDGLLFDEPGTAATMTHRIPANIFGRNTSLDPGLHHYGLLVHLSPATLELIGRPEDEEKFTPLRVADVSHISAGHGALVQMPFPVSDQDLQGWRDYLWPALGIDAEPKPEVIELLQARYDAPWVPNNLTYRYVFEDDVAHEALGTFKPVEREAPRAVLSAKTPRQLAGELPILPEWERDLTYATRFSKHREVLVFANPEAMTTVSPSIARLVPVRHGEIGICWGLNFGTAIIDAVAEQDPDVFLPVVFWERDRSAARRVRSDSWTLTLRDAAGWSDAATATPTKKGPPKLSSTSEGSGKQVFARVVDRIQTAFDGKLATPPDPGTWDSICSSRLDIERWIGYSYTNLSIAQARENNRKTIAFQNTPEQQTFLRKNGYRSSL